MKQSFEYLFSVEGDVRSRQKPLRQLYKEIPKEAVITDRARTVESDPNDPWHGGVIPRSVNYGVTWHYGIHRAVGGDHDAPNPGDRAASA